MIVVTGGAGFIGSHLVDRLLELGYEVLVIDNFCSGKIENLKQHEKNPNLKIVKADIRDKEIVKHLENAEAIFHLAADPDVRLSVENPSKSFEINMIGSFNVLEAARKLDIKDFIFTSSGGTVYGDTAKPVDEEFRLRPISPYGASKAAFEMYLSAYAHSYGMNCISLRLGNIIGPRSTHGVTWDFFWKLKKDKSRLVILGNGEQEKSYLHVKDAISAIILAWKKSKGFEAYNIAHEKTLKVREIARIVCEELKVNPKFEFTGGERGWRGDVKIVKLKIEKIKKLGWKPRVEPEEAIRDYVKWLVEKFGF